MNRESKSPVLTGTGLFTTCNSPDCVDISLIADMLSVHHKGDFMYRIEVLPEIPGESDLGKEFAADTLEQAKKKIDELVIQYLSIFLDDSDMVHIGGRVVIRCSDPDGKGGFWKTINIERKRGSKCAEVSYPYGV